MTVRFILLCSQNRLLRLAILPAQCPQLHNQRVFQPASLATASSSSISVQSLWETESLQLDTVSTIKEDVVSSSIYLATGKNNLLISKNNLRDSPFHLTVHRTVSCVSHLASTVSPTTQSASVPASIIGYSTSSSSISVQSLWETESLQLDTVSTIKEDVVSSSIYLATGKNNLLISKNNLLISCAVWQSVSSYFVHRTVSCV